MLVTQAVNALGYFIIAPNNLVVFHVLFNIPVEEMKGRDADVNI